MTPSREKGPALRRGLLDPHLRRDGDWRWEDVLPEHRDKGQRNLVAEAAHQLEATEAAGGNDAKNG